MNYVISWLDETLWNSKCRLCKKRDEAVNRIRKCSQLAQVRLGQEGYSNLRGELCKSLNFDYIDKWNMHRPESIVENKTYKIMWDFEM